MKAHTQSFCYNSAACTKSVSIRTVEVRHYTEEQDQPPTRAGGDAAFGAAVIVVCDTGGVR